MIETITVAEYKEKQKKPKYRNVKTNVDGIYFDSKAESRDYTYLKQKLNISEIKNLELQPKYELKVNSKKIGTYKADFKFYDNNTKAVRVVDRKGLDTNFSKRSRKHLYAQEGVNVEIWKLSTQNEFYKGIKK